MGIGWYRDLRKVERKSPAGLASQTSGCLAAKVGATLNS